MPTTGRVFISSERHRRLLGRKASETATANPEERPVKGNITGALMSNHRRLTRRCCRGLQPFFIWRFPPADNSAQLLHPFIFRSSPPRLPVVHWSIIVNIVILENQAINDLVTNLMIVQFHSCHDLFPSRWTYFRYLTILFTFSEWLWLWSLCFIRNSFRIIFKYFYWFDSFIFSLTFLCSNLFFLFLCQIKIVCDLSPSNRSIFFSWCTKQ